MITETFYIKPREGLKVRDPAGGHLPKVGAAVPRSSYWLRRLRDGDVAVGTTPAPPATSAPEPAAQPAPQQRRRKRNA